MALVKNANSGLERCLVMTKCPYCLNGWRRDIGEDSHDEECKNCNGTGFIHYDEIKELE